MQFVLPLFFKRISTASDTQGAEAFSDLLAALGLSYLYCISGSYHISRIGIVGTVY
ncbi:MAG: hypothetical protein IPM78_14080 [Moraxellaceae bacterium]|nr:hypothetical protein [Moraxellaceae bacterium]